MPCQQYGINLYPNVILSDSVIQQIVVNNCDLEISFSEYGFVKKEPDDNYYRVEDSKLIVRGCSFDDISIKELRTLKVSDEFFFESAYDLDKKVFLEQINSGSWNFEVVEEFYATGKGLFIGQIHSDSEVFWCCVKVRYKDLMYQWGNIRHDWPFD